MQYSKRIESMILRLQCCTTTIRTYVIVTETKVVIEDKPVAPKIRKTLKIH